MRMSRLAVAGYLLLVFFSGALLGAFGYRLYTVSTVSANKLHDSAEFRRHVLNEYRDRLQLSADQVQRLNAIFDDMRTRYHDAHEHTKQLIKAEQSDAIRGILNPNQRAEYEKMREERARHQTQPAKPAPPGM
ncbi:MAG: hypothetical protein ABI165_13095 [Bryobacteraceae bacterium]